MRVTQLDISDASSSDNYRMLDAQFHTHIAECAENLIILDSLEVLMNRMSTFSMYSRRDAATQAWDEHREILAAIGTGDANAAAGAMRAHLTNSRGRFRGLLTSGDASATD
jgi:DNA-binding GntR family transcriptional regulator